MFVLESPGALVKGNELDRNQNHGLEANSGSEGIVLHGNKAWGNVGNGLVVGAMAHAEVSANVLTGNGDSGLFFFDLIDSTVVGNTARGNSIGIVLAGGQHGSSGNLVSRNDVSRNHVLGLLLDTGADHNTVSANTANGNQGGIGEGGGIVVVSSTGNALVGNIASRNLSVGIGIFEDTAGDSAGNSLRRNTANGNAEHGIDAPAGTVDLGGNAAHGNTSSPNCLGVTCH